MYVAMSSIRPKSGSRVSRVSRSVAGTRLTPKTWVAKVDGLLHPGPVYALLMKTAPSVEKSKRACASFHALAMLAAVHS
jgi:hypothetical protein